MKKYLCLLMLTGNAYISGANVPAVTNLAHNLTPQNITDSLVDCALMDKRAPYALLDAINSANIKNFTPQNITDVLLSFALMDKRAPDALLNAINSTNLKHFTSQNIADVLWFFAIMNKRAPDALLNAMTPGIVNDLTDSNLADVLWALDRIEIIRRYPTIFDAVKAGDIDAVDYFLKNGVEINLSGTETRYFGKDIDPNSPWRQDERSPLRIALYNLDVQMAKFLIKQGADKNQITTSTHTGNDQLPFERALDAGNIEMMLFIANLDLNHTKNILNCLCTKKTHLYLAIFNNNKELAKCLIDCGANPNIKNTDNKWDMPLHLAIRQGDIEMVELLVQKGASFKSWNHDSEGALCVAIRTQNLEMLRCLGRLGITPYELHRSPFILAQHLRNVEIMRFLFEIGLDISQINSKINYGTTSILYAIMRDGDIKMAQLLIEQGANVNIENKDKERPLHWAIDNENMPMVTLLVEKGADVYAPNSKGTKPLQLAIDTGNTEIIEYLQKQGAN